jgi:hypothetical protein
VASGRALVTGLLLAKEIANAPHNVLNSESSADAAQRLASTSTNGNRVDETDVAVGNPPSAPMYRRQVHSVFQETARKGFGRGRLSGASGYERNPRFWGVCYSDLSLAVIEAATSFMRQGGGSDFTGVMVVTCPLTWYWTRKEQFLSGSCKLPVPACVGATSTQRNMEYWRGEITSKSMATPVSQGTPGSQIHSSLLLCRGAFDPASTFHPGGAPC